MHEVPISPILMHTIDLDLPPLTDTTAVGATPSAVTAAYMARVPGVTAVRHASVIAVKATHTGSASAPVVMLPAIFAPVAALSAQAPIPVITAGQTVTAVKATAASSASVPVVTVAGDAFVTAVRANSSALASIPVVSGSTSVTVSAVRATHSGLAIPPTTGLSASVNAVVARTNVSVPAAAKPPQVEAEIVVTGGGPGAGSMVAYVPAISVPTPIVVGSASVTGGTTSMICTKPTGTANGDIMIAYQTTTWNAYANMTAPAGWTLLTGLDRGLDNLHVKIWTKIAASEGANYTFVQGTANDSCISIVTLRGVNTNTVNWLYAAPIWAASSASRIAASVSGAAAGSILLCFSMHQGAAVADLSYTPPAGMTELQDVISSIWLVHTVAMLANPANPTGTKTFTLAGTRGVEGGIENSIVIPGG